MWLPLLVELIGGAMLVLGWKARWVAAALAVYTVRRRLSFMPMERSADQS